MSGPAPAPATFYRPAEVAALLRCSEWWVKEQARNRRIPYAWIGGSYLFTREHIAEIVRRFEVQPIDGAAPVNVVRLPAPRPHAVDSGEPPARLRARPPRRRRTESNSSAA
jgi:hypothetical protein